MMLVSDEILCDREQHAKDETTRLYRIIEGLEGRLEKQEVAFENQMNELKTKMGNQIKSLTI